MTIKEALEYLDTIPTIGEQVDALEMAIKALEQEPCEDCISREAVLDGLASIAKVKARSDAQKSLMGRVMFFTECLPSVTPKEKTGCWIKTPGMNEQCDVCGSFFPLSDFAGRPFKINHCPNCGCRMRGDSNGNE